MSELNPCYALQGSDGQTLVLQTDRLALQAVNNVRKLRLQARPDTEINPAPLEALLGMTLPQNPREKVNHEPAAYWLAPNDWLLLDPAPAGGNISNVLREAAGGATCVVTDVSDAWSIIEISGADAAAKLAEGCSVDLDDDAFPVGRYALTRLQHLSIIIHRLDDRSKFHLLVDRNLARFLWDWLRM